MDYDHKLVELFFIPSELNFVSGPSIVRQDIERLRNTGHSLSPAHRPLIINGDLDLHFANDQERCHFLWSVLSRWRGRTILSCREIPKRPADGADPTNWSFVYHYPSGHESCRRMARILSRIFPSPEQFHALPFVVEKAYDQYAFSLNRLHFYVSHGAELTECHQMKYPLDDLGF